MSRSQGIYQIRNTVNGKIYIGSSVNMEHRWKDHKSRLRRGIHANRYMQHAWDKSGEDNFVFEKIEDIQEVQTLRQREQWYLDNRIRWGFDYNIAIDAENGTRGRKHSQLTIKKQSLVKLGNKNPMFGLTAENCHNSKLKESDIPKIRDMYATEKYTLVEIANIFGLKSSSAIRRVIFGTSWNHVYGGKKTSYRGRPGAKIEMKDVLEIREMYETGDFTQKQIGHLFGLMSNSVSMIITRKNWKDI